MEQVLKNTSIIGTSISIQLEQWQLKRQLMELHQQQQRAALQQQQQQLDSGASLAAAPSAIPPASSLNRTLLPPLNLFHPPGAAAGFGGTFSSHNGNFSSHYPHHHSTSSLFGADIPDDVDQQSLVSIMGPARETDQVLLSMTLIYSIILFSGIIGNTLTLYVIWRHPRMHAGATNYYLASLAISDLISLVFGLPLEMFQLFQSHPYPLPEYACVARGWLTEMATNSSVLCILLFSFERYLAVVHPFQIRLRSRVYRALPLVVCAWLIAFLAAAPIALQLGIVYKVVNRFTGVPRDGTQLCIIKHPLPHSFQLSTVFLFVVPMLIIIVFHVVIVIKLVHASRSQGSLNRATSSEGAAGEGGRRNDPTLRFSRGRRAVLRMLASVALAFFICYAPFHSQRLLASYLSNIVGNDPSAFAAYKTYLFISGILYYSASTVNPILYNILSIRFRRAFLEALVGCIPGCAGSGGSPTGSPDTHHGNARNHHHFHQLRRQYTNTGTNECNSIGGGGYDADGYSLSSRVVALNAMSAKNSSTANGSHKSRTVANGATGHQHRRVAGPCQSASNNSILNSNLLHTNSGSNASVVWRANSCSSQSECDEAGTFAGDENASADYSTTQSLELNNNSRRAEKRRKGDQLSSSQRRRLLLDNSRQNSTVGPFYNNGGHRASQRSNSHQPHQFTNMLTSTASQRDRAVSFESATAEIVDGMRMCTPPFRMSPSSEMYEVSVAQQQLDFDPRVHRDSNASIDSILVAKATLSQRNSPTDAKKGVPGAQTALTLGSAVANAPSNQTTPSHCSTTDRYFLGDTLTAKTEQLKQRVAVKKAAKKAMRDSLRNHTRQSIAKHQHTNGHNTASSAGTGELKTQQSVDSIDGSKCGQWINRATRKQQHRRQSQSHHQPENHQKRTHRKEAVVSELGQKTGDEKSVQSAVVCAAQPSETAGEVAKQKTETVDVQLLPTSSIASSSDSSNTFGADAVFDYADNGDEVIEEQESATLLPSVVSTAIAFPPAQVVTTITAEKVETTLNSAAARTLTVKTSNASANMPSVNIVISPPSVSSRSDSIHSGSNMSGHSIATQV